MDEMASYYPPPPPHQPSSYPSYQPYYPPPPPQSYAPPPPQPPPSYSHYHYTPPQPYHQPFPSYNHQPQSQPQPQPQPHSHQHELKTLFIAGLPEDVKPREIYNLFREFHGYQSSQLRSATNKTQPYGFAVFKDQQSAVAALQALNGLVFDLEKQSTLYIDLAKSNSRSKRSRADDGAYGLSDKKIKGYDAFTRGHPDTGVGSNIYMPGMTNSAHNMIGYASTQSHGYDPGALNGVDMKGTDLVVHRQNTSTPYVPRNNTPCPTLFVANLGQTCTEQELNQVFSRWPGFLKLKMQNKNGAPVAFVDFQDTACSTAALDKLQDCILQSSTGEGMRLEYAKSRMGMRKKSS